MTVERRHEQYLFLYLPMSQFVCFPSVHLILTRQIVSALGFLHRNGFVHRDLKPENLLLDNIQKLKLIGKKIVLVVVNVDYANGSSVFLMKCITRETLIWFD